MKCALCRKGGCKPWERNTDGTYTHSGCLYATAIVVAGKGPKGGHLFAESSKPTSVPDTGMRGL